MPRVDSESDIPREVKRKVERWKEDPFSEKRANTEIHLPPSAPLSRCIVRNVCASRHTRETADERAGTASRQTKERIFQHPPSEDAGIHTETPGVNTSRFTLPRVTCSFSRRVSEHLALRRTQTLEARASSTANSIPDLFFLFVSLDAGIFIFDSVTCEILCWWR